MVQDILHTNFCMDMMPTCIVLIIATNKYVNDKFVVMI